MLSRPSAERWLVLAFAIAALGFLAAPPASAAPFPARLDFAYELAVGYWGQEPSACSAVDREVVPHGSLGSLETKLIAGLATQVPPETAPGSVDCILWIDRSYAQPVLFSGLCALMIHEVGHLLGMGHSADPASVMNEKPAIPPICAAKGRELSRMVLLKRRLQRLRLHHGARIGDLRRLTQRSLIAEAAEFQRIPIG